MKHFFPITILAFMASTCFAHDVQKKLDEHKKDPKTETNAAKADVFVSKNKIIADSTSSVSSANKSVTGSKLKKKKKSKPCSK